MKDQPKLAESKNNYWKAKGENGQAVKIPLPELDDDHLQKAYYVSQNKELEYMNKYGIFADMREKLEREAERRGMTLKSIADNPNKHIRNYFRKPNS